MYQHVLIPTDGSQLSVSAVESGMRFACDAGAKVTVVAVVEPFHAVSTDSKQLSETRSVYEKHAKAAEAIIETAATKGCDLIAMASHGRRGVSAMLMGSETVKVLTHSSTPVLVFR